MSWSRSGGNATTVSGVPISAAQAAILAALPAAPVSGALLASMQYAPTVLDNIVLSTTLAALDTTNLTLALTVPASGKVTIEVEFYGQTVDTTGGNVMAVGLLNHTGGAQLGKTIPIAQPGVSGTTFLIRSVATFLLTGLTPGALQVDFAAGCSNTTTGSAAIYAQGVTGNPTISTSGPLIMQAFAG